MHECAQLERLGLEAQILVPTTLGKASYNQVPHPQCFDLKLMSTRTLTWRQQAP